MMTDLDILDRPPPSEQETVCERYRTLAVGPVLPDPRTVPYRPARRALGDLTKGLILFAAIIGMWWSTIELIQLAASLSAR